eukprot:gene4932-5174_t
MVKEHNEEIRAARDLPEEAIKDITCLSSCNCRGCSSRRSSQGAPGHGLNEDSPNLPEACVAAVAALPSLGCPARDDKAQGAAAALDACSPQAAGAAAGRTNESSLAWMTSLRSAQPVNRSNSKLSHSRLERPVAVHLEDAHLLGSLTKAQQEAAARKEDMWSADAEVVEQFMEKYKKVLQAVDNTVDGCSCAVDPRAASQAQSATAAAAADQCKPSPATASDGVGGGGGGGGGAAAETLEQQEVQDTCDSLIATGPSNGGSWCDGDLPAGTDNAVASDSVQVDSLEPADSVTPGCSVPVSADFRAHQSRQLRQHVVIAAAHEEEIAAAEQGAPVDPRARRLQRQQRRATRKRSGEEAWDNSGENQAAGTEVAAVDIPETEAPSRPAAGSRIAARRRSRATRRVPAALVPDMDGSDDVDDLSDDLIDDDRQDFTVNMPAADAAAGSYHEVDAEDEESAEDADEQDGPAVDVDSEGEEGEQTADQDSVSQAIPTSVFDAIHADNQQRHRATQQQRQYRVDPVELPEANPMYVPVLTDEDLAADPPGHKSGYVAVIGRPNAGKSTLINAVVGQKLSIVTFKPQTTRHRVVGIASGPEYQMILFDTPGIMQEQRSKLDERMMAAVVSSIKAAEVIIAVVDSGDAPQEALAMFQPGPDWSGPPMAVLLNKADLLEQQQMEELEAWYQTNSRAEQVFVGSALSSEDAGVTAIKAWAIDKLPEGPTLYPKSMVSEQPERFFVSEIIREQIFLQFDQEIPYSCQVQIAEFKERPNAKDYVRAVILVERESQAPILLGKGGAAVKKLGAAARSEIEEFLGRKVYLEISVQVAPAWRQQSDKLKDFGYFDPLYIT